MRKSLFRIIGAVAAVFVYGQAYAGGIALYEIGTPDVGLAAAGYAARVQDASTVFTNPAGMSFLDKSQAMTGLQFLYGDAEFDTDSNTTATGGDGRNAIGWMPGGNLFVVQKLDKNLSVGLGILSYFGLGEDYGDGWAGRYYVQNSMLAGITVTPAVSYRVAEGVSLGAGLNAMYGYMSTEVAINNIGEARPDGQLEYTNRDWGYGGNFGILVEPMQGTRLGLTYLTPVKLKFSTSPSFTGLGPVLETVLTNRGLTTNDLGIDITVPQMVMFSVYQNLNDKFVVMANVGWQDWSQFGKVDIQIDSSDPQSLTVDNNYDDTWHGALGLQYRQSDKLTLTCGIAYDSSAVKNSDRTVTIPMGASQRYAIGSLYSLRPDLTLGTAYELVWYGDMTVDQERGPLAGRVSGQYDDMYINVYSLNLNWKY